MKQMLKPTQENKGNTQNSKTAMMKDASPQTEGHSSIPTNEIKSDALQSEIKRECHVCQQTRKVQGKKRAKTTLPTRQYPSQ